MKIIPPFQRAWEVKKNRPNDVAAMLRRSEGRTLVELCLLVGRTAEVMFSDYGCSGERISWHERVTITAFLGPLPMEIYDGEGRRVKSVLVPTYEVRCYEGVGTIPLCNLKDIQSPDRVCLQCDYCRHDAPGHHPGCPLTRKDFEAALACWLDGRREFHKWCKTRFKPEGWDRFLRTNPTFYLGYIDAEEQERRFQADYDMPSWH